MPINAAQTYLQQLLDQMAMPLSGVPPLAAYITPPDPNVEAEAPTAYIWPSTGDESRDSRKGGTVPRNTGPGTPSGWKNIAHSLNVYVVWFMQDDDELADTAFPSIVDAIMFQLRTAPNPAPAIDPFTQQQSWLLDIGENMTYRIDLRAVADQRYNRYDALITVPVAEVFQA
jgi:hypothetical protein